MRMHIYHDQSKVTSLNFYENSKPDHLHSTLSRWGVVGHITKWFDIWRPSPNKAAVLSVYEPYVKIGRSRDHLIFNMGIPTHAKDGLILRRGLDSGTIQPHMYKMELWETEYFVQISKNKAPWIFSIDFAKHYTGFNWILPPGVIGYNCWKKTMYPKNIMTGNPHILCVPGYK